MVAALLVWQGGAVRDVVGTLIVGSKGAAYAATPRAVLVERLESAEAEAERTRYQAIVYQTVVDQYEALKQEAGQRSEDAFMTAQVIARPPKTHYDTLLLAAGSDDGVRVGDRVEAERVLLGEVSAVSAGTATVSLFSTPGSERDVRVGEPSAIVILSGQGGGAFEASIPTTVLMKAGDVAVDEATGLVVALVGSVTHAPTDVAAVVRLSLPVALSTLTEVSLTHPRP